MILIAVLLIVLFYFTTVKPYLFWYLQGIQKKIPIPLLGDTWKFILGLEDSLICFRRIYNSEPNSRYIGYNSLTIPFLMIRDPELIKKIAVSDFDHFTDHDKIIPASMTGIWHRTLFSLKGKEWREMRPILSPAFTSSKMKIMTLLLNQCGQQFAEFYLRENKKVIELELKESLSRYSNDVIASCIFGIKCDSLKEPHNDFFQNSYTLTNGIGITLHLKVLLNTICPKLVKFFDYEAIPASISNFYVNSIKDNVKYREENNIVRLDILHLMMEARKGRLQYDEDSNTSKLSGFATVEESNVGKVKSKKRNIEITDKEMAAQMGSFIFAGFETISSAAMFMAYHLAMNPQIQEKLLKEIDEIGAKRNQIGFEDLAKMEYLDMVLTETLRLHPTSPLLNRICTLPYTIQPKTSKEKPLHVKVGQKVIFPVDAIQHDPLYYPNPECFDPERFSRENKENIKPYTFMPFGVGPRSCIGSRFALLEMKILFYHLLSHFTIKVSPRTRSPYKVAKMTLLTKVVGGMWVALEKRN